MGFNPATGAIDENYRNNGDFMRRVLTGFGGNPNPSGEALGLPAQIMGGYGGAVPQMPQGLQPDSAFSEYNPSSASPNAPLASDSPHPAVYAPPSATGNVGNKPITGDSRFQAYSSAAADPNSFANQMLGKYGQRLPTNPNPLLLFGNQPGSFGANHPKVASGIDNIVGTLANMGPSSLSAGDNISNVARGIMGNRQQHYQGIMQQYQQPFQVAGQAAGLQHQQDESTLLQAHSKYFNEIGDAREQQAKNAAELNKIRQTDFTNRHSENMARLKWQAAHADPQANAVITKNQERQAAGQEPMSADEEQQYRNHLVAQTSSAQAQGKKDVAKINAAGKGARLSPQDKMAYDAADKDLKAANAQLTMHLKTKETSPGTYEQSGGDQRLVDLNNEVKAKTAARDAIVQRAGHGPNRPSPNKNVNDLVNQYK